MPSLKSLFAGKITAVQQHVCGSSGKSAASAEMGEFLKRLRVTQRLINEAGYIQAHFCPRLLDQPIYRNLIGKRIPSHTLAVLLLSCELTSKSL